MSNSDQEIYFDGDGFVTPGLYSSPSENPTSFLPAATTVEQLRHSAASGDVELGIAHYLLRSAFTLPAGAGEEVWKFFKRYSRRALYDAEYLLRRWNEVREPEWLLGFSEALKGSPLVDARTVEEIKLSFTLHPKLYAFSYPHEKRLEISAVTPVYLRSVNLVIWNLAIALQEQLRELEMQLPNESWSDLAFRYAVARRLAQGNFRSFLPYLFAMYCNDVNFSSLPVPRALNRDAFTRARQSMIVQMHFMLSHEIGHLLLHGDREPGPAIEREADEFAYAVLVGEEKLWKNRQGEFFTSVNWLFHYLAIDRSMGSFLSGYETDWVDVPIRDREALLYPRLSGLWYPPGDNDLQALGVLILIGVKAELQEFGVDRLKEAAQEFRRHHCFQSK